MSHGRCGVLLLLLEKKKKKKKRSSFDYWLWEQVIFFLHPQPNMPDTEAITDGCVNRPVPDPSKWQSDSYGAPQTARHSDLHPALFLCFASDRILISCSHLRSVATFHSCIYLELKLRYWEFLVGSWWRGLADSKRRSFFLGSFLIPLWLSCSNTNKHSVELHSIQSADAAVTLSLG